MMCAVVLCFSLVVQEPDAPSHHQPAPAPPAPPGVEGLKDRIRGMRKDLLTGGELVRRSESEAVDFYQEKIEEIDRRVDSIQAELAESRADYDLALERTLQATSMEARRNAAADASVFRSRIDALEAEEEELGRRRAGFARAVQLIQQRSTERQRLATQMDTAPSIDLPGFLPPVGLAPDVAPPANPLLDDPGLIEDLLRRDPVRAREILFAANPEEYWRRWPLRPPADVLARSIPFPDPDLPGQR